MPTPGEPRLASRFGLLVVVLAAIGGAWWWRHRTSDRLRHGVRRRP